MNPVIAQRNFEVEASRDRVWRLIGKVIFSSLPDMENVEILDENNFRALLKIRVSPIKLSIKLKGEIVDMSPPESFAVKLELKGLRGLFRLNQKVTIAMTSVESLRTAITCMANVERMGILFKIMFLGQARRFALSTFDDIEKRLKELA